MAGIRIGGSGVALVLSPPFTAYGGAATSGDPQVWRWRSSDLPGEATAYTDFSGFADSDQNFNPVLSPDGTKILFEVLSPATNFREVWVVDNVPGSTPTQLVADASNYVIHPFWGPDSDTFVYCHFTGGALVSGAILKDTVSSPGSPTTLKSAVANFAPFRPMFNFDGTRVAYIYVEDGGAAVKDLRCMDDDGTNDQSLDNTITAFLSNDPPQLCWARTQNLIAYSDGSNVARNTYVIEDDGTNKTQIDANGDAAGANTNVSGLSWAPADEFVVITGNIGSGYITMFRAEVDGSDTTALGTSGADNNNFVRGGLVYGNRIWFIKATSPATIGSMALDGSDNQVNFNASLGSGDAVSDLGSGDGWYFN